jgi:hypothetical protein
MATPLDASKALLNRLGIPWSNNRLVGLVAFAAIEGGHWLNKATYNPWNTTLSMPGAVSKNSAGVKAYTSWEQGIEANARTMAQPNMRAIIDALKADVSPHDFLAAVTNTQWCPKYDANGNPTGCESYETVNAEEKFREYANKEDNTALALGSRATNWGLILGATLALGLIAAAVWYFSRGELPFARALGARENPVKRGSRRRGRGRSKVQTLIFPRSRFTTSSAKAWARRNGFLAGKVDVTDRSIRLRQRSPSGFSRMRTISMGPDVKAVVGFPS